MHTQKPTLSGRFLSSLRNECAVPADALVVVGVSGGADSLFLLEQFRAANQPVIAACFDHQLRPESAEECAFVRRFCTERGVRCVTGNGDVRAAAKNEKMTIEEAGRNLRYRFLIDTVRTLNAAAVAVAHHADDQAETILMHFLRGSGLEGLRGMQARSFQADPKIPIIRPLLKFWRAEIDEWIQSAGITPVSDPSNADAAYYRNRLRLLLLPEIARNYNPAIKQSLLRIGGAATADMEIIQAAVQQAQHQCELRETEDTVTYNRKLFSAQSHGMRMRLLREAVIRLLPFPQNLSFELCQSGITFFENARWNEKRLWFGNLQLAALGDTLLITTKAIIHNMDYPQFFTDKPIQFEIGDVVDLNGWRITAEQVPNAAETAEQMRKFETEAYMDAASIVPPIFIRKANVGERFTPIGISGSQKISDFWINQRIPRDFRPAFPVVADANGMIWIPGLRMSSRVRVTETTQTLLIFRIKQIPDQ